MPTARIRIDSNIRLGTRITYARYEDVTGLLPSPGDEVEVFEEESGASGTGWLLWVNPGCRLVFLEVDWSSVKTPETDAGADAA